MRFEYFKLIDARLFLIAALIGSFATAANAFELSGKPFVHDGDSLYIAKIPVRLFGIDACELTQAAITIDGQHFDCGQAAKQHLQQLTGDWIICRLGKKDQYQRFLGTCFNAAKIEINRQMVADGFAMAYRRGNRPVVKRFLKLEKAAKKKKLGLWQSEFVNPKKWRKTRLLNTH